MFHKPVGPRARSGWAVYISTRSLEPPSGRVQIMNNQSIISWTRAGPTFFLNAWSIWPGHLPGLSRRSSIQPIISFIPWRNRRRFWPASPWRIVIIPILTIPVPVNHSVLKSLNNKFQCSFCSNPWSWKQYKQVKRLALVLKWLLFQLTKPQTTQKIRPTLEQTRKGRFLHYLSTEPQPLPVSLFHSPEKTTVDPDCLSTIWYGSSASDHFKVLLCPKSWDSFPWAFSWNANQ